MFSAHCSGGSRPLHSPLPLPSVPHVSPHPSLFPIIRSVLEAKAHISRKSVRRKAQGVRGKCKEHTAKTTLDSLQIFKGCNRWHGFLHNLMSHTLLLAQEYVKGKGCIKNPSISKAQILSPAIRLFQTVSGNSANHSTDHRRQIVQSCDEGTLVQREIAVSTTLSLQLLLGAFHNESMRPCVRVGLVHWPLDCAKSCSSEQGQSRAQDQP